MMIIAGYEEELDQTFFRINSGMNSRFIWRFHIDGYGVEELTQIFQKFVRDASWQLAKEVDVKWFSEKKDHFKYNGRDMELLFSYVKVAHAQRIYGKDASLKTMITIEDMNKGYAIFEENKKLKKKENLFGLYI
jgi:SpoVK/Ycf46/Vps4 family AAA+-type ATPase